jgi:intein/homing endonuclease
MLKFFKNIIRILIKGSIELIEKYEYRNLSLNEDDINKKILSSMSLMDLKVKTDTGYELVSDIHLTQPFKHYKISTIDFELCCADNHIVFDKDFREVFIKNLKSGDFIQTENGLQEVLSINIDGFKSSMFDLTIDHPNHRFYTNGILSHNTISASIFMLHTILFSNDKNIMIVANKGDTAVEIVDKIKSIYALLPFFLKPGIKTWNQKSLTFENGCRIKTSARTKTPAIGFTIDVLYLDEFAHIPSNIIEPYYTAAFPTVSAVMNSKIIITSTPNGMNLFHRILTDAERPDGDPKKNNYKAMRVYWYQVPGRFVTYIRLNNHKMYDYGVNKEDIFNLVKNTWSSRTLVEMKFIEDFQKDVIYVYNNDFCSDDDVRKMTFLDKNGHETPFMAISELTTWKEEAIKDIGGEDAFNQEYGLRFINSSKSLLNESLIEDLLKNKKHYIYEQIPEFDRKLRFSYSDLKWIDDDKVFMPIQRKEARVIISVDISEGLGQDYSVINIFKVSPKPKDLIESQKRSYKNIVNFFRLEQIGIFRNNFVSVKQLSELLYMIVFEYFNYENVKVVLELNNYGGTLLAEMPHVFEGNNNYGSSVFARYKHRSDSTEEKIGLKVGDNKNLMVKDYQELMQNKGFVITNEDNIREITTFVKHVSSSGNIKYAADIGHDDCLLPNTLIKTIDGYRKIKDIRVGDEVLTHLGNYKKVTNICIKDFDGDMYKLKFKGQLSLDITYNHPIYIASENYSRNEYKNGNYNKYTKRSWLLPNEIKNKHRCVNIQESYKDNINKSIDHCDLFERHKNFSEKNIKLKSIKLDHKFAKFLGLFLADGNCYKNKSSYRVSIAFNKNQKELIEEIKSYFIELKLNYVGRFQNKNGYNLSVNNKTLYELLVKCYDLETKEKILPNYAIDLGLDLKYVLEYWLKGDGWICNREGRQKSIIGCSTSISLALSMKDIANNIGKHALISSKKRNRYGIKCKDQYWVHIYDNRPTSSSLKKISNFELSSKIDIVEKYNYRGVTYNLEVEDDNSYIANGIVVHNCVMTIVNTTSIFSKNDFREMVEDYASKMDDKSFMAYINECLKNMEYVEGVDYSQVLRIRRQQMNRYKGGKGWYGS